jgi:hypothetical protein
MRNVFRSSVLNPEGKTLGNSRFRWKDNINIDFIEVLREGTGFS